MKRKLIPTLLATALAISPLGLRANEQTIQTEPTTPQTEISAPPTETTSPKTETSATPETDNEAKEPREVGAASTDAAAAARTRKWQNIGIAALAVAVAATAIYLASTNGGHND
jgi:hypothetical protein